MLTETSTELVVLTSSGEYTLTKAKTVEDYAVWHGNKLIAVGGFRLMQQIFNEKGKPDMTVTTGGNPSPPAINIEQRVQQYIKLRDTIKEKDDAHKEAMKPYRELLEKLNGVLLQHLHTVGVDSARTGAGTVYRTVKKSVSLENPDEFMRHVIGTENYDLLERKASQAGVEDFVKENGVLPPGVKYSTTEVVGVRKS
ncbi:hypothetical protein EVB41_074 [Rhizobium phage RHph_TM3_14A]|nr:hypothetical protein EVB29_075 [Rhizobium phage RHph_TM27A]QIG66995.1 hypothetical protein EVB30_075 [Rhizobium phage RHph_TM27B]QIG67083.1 hypothetical protein EVB31_073 [Rhizobium phage RHph_TM29]QIG67539.1 hypothetical protein EVB41_074 [Rhizobium phage RHph_TM3_14A]